MHIINRKHFLTARFSNNSVSAKFLQMMVKTLYFGGIIDKKKLHKLRIRLKVFFLSSFAYRLGNLFFYSCKIGKNWFFSSNIGPGLNFTYEFEVCFSVHCTMIQWSRAPQPVEGALVFLSLWREPWCYSVWGVKNFFRLLFCLTPPEKVVLIVRQGGPNCRTKLILSDNLDHYLAKIQGGPNSPTKWF